MQKNKNKYHFVWNIYRKICYYVISLLYFHIFSDIAQAKKIYVTAPCFWIMPYAIYMMLVQCCHLHVSSHSCTSHVWFMYIIISLTRYERCYIAWHNFFNFETTFWQLLLLLLLLLLLSFIRSKNHQDSGLVIYKCWKKQLEST